MSYRLKWPNLHKEIVEILTRVLASNPYVETFKRLAELGPLDNYRVTLNASVELDQRVYNRPTTSEVAGIWVEGNDNITAYKRSIVIYGRSDKPQTIRHYWGCYDPLCYPLFFPNGEPGWHSNITREGFSVNEIVNDDDNMEDDLEDTNDRKDRKTVTMREYYCYKFQIREQRNLILLGGRLFQQFVVDTYVKIETSRLDFCRKNQSTIRAELYQGVVDCVTSGEVQPSMIGQRVVLPASFIGGPRDMRRRFLDAMALVQERGKPDIFLTMTCNPKWPEIQSELLPWQKAEDRPNLVSRVFRAKFEDLKEQLLKRHILGVVGAYVYVIEFQKRGLPHAHVLLIMRPNSKLTNPDQYDKYVCAEIPNPTKYPLLPELVKAHMMHGPCGSLNPKCLCMQGDPPKCRYRYPQQFNESTTQGEDAYPVYRRRNTGITVKKQGVVMDNRSVVPYNPKMLMMFNCHINVDVCSSTIFLICIELNKEDMSARQCLYKDFPKHFTWNNTDRLWNPRKIGSTVGHLASANPAEGERYYLRLLLCHVTGPTSFEDLYTFNNIKYPTFRKAALERGIIESDESLSQCLAQASLFQFPNALRRLFATILVFCDPRDVRKLWNDHYIALSEDYVRQFGNAARFQNMVLTDITLFLQSMGRNLRDFDLPTVNTYINVQSRVFREIMRHVSTDCAQVFFIDGPGGTGKTYLYKALLATIRKSGHIALATASSGVAANNMPGGEQLAHASRFLSILIINPCAT
ncbi:hypothetical protein LXL04_028872 [Taraxacum kok-saghyz]